MRLKLISCAVFHREMCAAAARSVNQVDLEFIPKGLHDIGAEGMSARLQSLIDGVDATGYEAIVFGYGLCNNGVAGLRARAIPLVLPRAHDCITLFLGGAERYAEYFRSHPGVYFKTAGWIERGEAEGELGQLSISQRIGREASYEELVAKYGEDNAQYLYETLHSENHHYSQYTYIEMGVEPDDRFERQTREAAAEKGWRFEKIRGDMAMIQRLLDGQWAEGEFLTVAPGQRVVADVAGGIIRAEAAS